jgi:UDP-N-acetylglucosamine:LPS N-acetylglucosamine transferase
MPDCQVLDWIDQANIAELIQDTDIAITRGSATTLAELTAFDKNPTLIIIPLPSSAGNHQYYNALEYEKE